MFKTVFLFYNEFPHMEHLYGIFILTGVIILPVIYLINKKLKGSKFDKIDYSLLGFLAIPFIVMLFFIYSYIEQITTYNDYKKIYLAEKYKIAEGIVDVQFEQPYEGHAGGDLVLVNGKKFVINYFSNDIYGLGHKMGHIALV